MDHKYAYFMAVYEYTGADGKKYYCAAVKRLESWADNGAKDIVLSSGGKLIELWYARSKKEAAEAADSRNAYYTHEGIMAWASIEMHHPKHALRA